MSEQQDTNLSVRLKPSKGKSTVKRYRYSPLPGPNYIRVLLLQPALSMDEPMVAELRNLDLDSGDQYAALSYSWAMEDGDARLLRTIEIDGRHVDITLNLFKGLRRIRKTEEVLCIWIDAVCINQEDLHERNSQVAKMAEIYRKADRVVIWLGEGDDPEADQRVKGILTRITAFDEDEGTVSDEHVRAVLHGSTEGWCEGETRDDHDSCTILPNTAIISSSSTSTIPEINRAFILSDEVQKQYRLSVMALHAFCTRRYWNRLWAAQEFSVARRQEWYWGPCSEHAAEVSRSQVGYLATVLTALDQGFENWYPKMASNQLEPITDGTFRHLMYLREYPQLARSDPQNMDKKLLWALHDTCEMNCNDPRDRLYALLGLCDNPPFAPDYSLSATELYVGFAALLVKSHMGHILLEQFVAEHSSDLLPEDQLSRSLPSWVPDLRQGFYSISNKPRTQPSDFHGTVSEDGGVLRCAVYRLGAYGSGVSRVGRSPSGPGQTLSLRNGLPGLQASFSVDFCARYDFQLLRGDLICASTNTLIELFDADDGAILMALRPVETRSNVYRLVGTSLFRPRSKAHIELDQDSKIFVNII